MKDLHQSLDTMREAKKFSLGHKIDALQQLIFQRFQALITISSIAFALSGIIISVRPDLIKNLCLGIFSVIVFVLIAIVSLGRYLYVIRDDIRAISKKIKDLPDENWKVPLEEKTFKADWWPETLYFILVLGVVLFTLSLL